MLCSLFLLHYLVLTAWSQTTEIDALERAVVKQEREDSTRVNQLNDLFDHYINRDMSKALEYGRQAFQLATKLNHQSGLAQNLILKGAYQYEEASFDSARALAHKSLSILAGLNENGLKVDAFALLGKSHSLESKFDSGLYYLYKAEQIAFDSGLQPRLAKAKSNLGTYYILREDLENAEVYYLQADSIASTLPPSVRTKDLKATILNNLGAVNENKGWSSGKEEHFHTALSFYNQGLSINKETANAHGVMKHQLCLSYVYRGLGEYQLAIKHDKLALNQAYLLGDNQVISEATGNIGVAYARLSDFEQAIGYLLKSIELTEKTGEVAQLSRFHNWVRWAYEKSNDYKEALYHHKRFKFYSDSVFNISKERQVEEIEVKYEVAKKNAEIAEQDNLILKQQASLSNTKNTLVLSLAGIIAISTLIISHLQKKKNQQRMAHNTQILKLHEQAHQYIIQTQETERKRISENLHDSIGAGLAAIKIGLTTIIRSDQKQPAEGQSLDGILTDLDQISGEVRQLSHELIPINLYEGGLPYAVHELLSKTLTNLNIAYEFEEHKIPELHSDLQINIYRIIQEAIANIIKHASATLVTVGLTHNGKQIVLSIEDNGIGCELPGHGLGLTNIKSRVNSFGGELLLHSSKNEGFSINVTIPL